MVVWIMLAYSCHTHVNVYLYKRADPPSRSPHTYPFGARARPTAAEGFNFVYAEGSDVGAFVARQPGLVPAACNHTLNSPIYYSSNDRSRTRAQTHTGFAVRTQFLLRDKNLYF